MKKIFLPFLVGVFFVIPAISSAGTRTIEVEWSMPDTTDISGYKLYYSYSADMAGQQVACSTNDPAATSLTCQDITIDSYPVYFTVAAVKQEEELVSMAEKVATPLSPVMNFTF